MEEDVTSSLNTLLDARPESATPSARSDTDGEKDRYVFYISFVFTPSRLISF